MRPAGLISALREATAGVHAHLDAGFGPGVVAQDLDSYRRWLRATRAWTVPVVRALHGTRGTSRLVSPALRGADTALRQDLHDLGAAAGDLEEFPAVDDQEALGLLYVVEGSRLGARSLIPEVGRITVEVPGCTRYLHLGGPSAGADWRRALQHLTVAGGGSPQADGVLVEAAVTGAVRTFEWASVHLQAAFGSRVVRLDPTPVRVPSGGASGG